MGAPVYATDLITLDDCNTDTGYVEPTASGWAQLNAESFAEDDLFIQNANCISATCKTGVGATLFNNTAGVTFPADGAFLIWAYWAAPNSLATEANGGIGTIIGSSQSDFDAFYHLGSDSYIYGGWVNLATGDPTYVDSSTFEGSPSGTLQYFGWCYNALAVPSKGNPYVVDCMRYGRCEISVVDGDAGNGYGTFTGMAAKNDANDAVDGYNRWGLFQAESASSFLWKGMMTLGTSATSTDFRDSNKSITIDNTKHVTKAFNKIEVNHASTRVDFTSVSITSLSTVSPGQFEAVYDADINIEGCTFTNMDTFIFQATSTILTSTFRDCAQITQGGGTFTTCVIDGTTSVTSAAVLSDNPSLITYCDFPGGGSWHAVTCETPGTYNWVGNTDTGYTGDRGTNDTPETGSTNAMFFNDSGGLITLNVGGGGQQPSVRNGVSATTTVNATINITFAKMKDNSEVRIYLTGTNTVVDGIEDATTGTEDDRSFAWSSGAGVEVDYIIHCFQPGDEIYQSIRVNGYTVPGTDTTIDIQQILDRNVD